MDKIRNTLEQIKQDIAAVLESDETLSQLSLTDLDDLLQNKYMLTTPKWDERKEDTKRIKDRYISLLKDEMDKLKALLHWKDTGYCCNNIDVNSYKGHVIEYINNTVLLDDENKWHNHVPAYNLAWQLVSDGKIKLTPDDVNKLDMRFIEYVMTRECYRNPFRVTMNKKHACDDGDVEECEFDLDYNESDNKVHMTHRERFWVNVLASGRGDIDADKVLVCLGMDVDPRMRFMPQKVTVFEDGDLLPQIASHYKNAQLSPMIKWRRNLGILLENMQYQFHDYLEFMENGVFLTHMFTLELPYMCYAYVDHVEVDVSDFVWGEEDKKGVGYVEVGNEYILSAFKPFDKHKTKITLTAQNINVVKKKCRENDVPGYYITISFGLMNSYKTVNAVRMYGKAISLI